jgi:hypothetical protein
MQENQAADHLIGRLVGGNAVRSANASFAIYGVFGSDRIEVAENTTLQDQCFQMDANPLDECIGLLSSTEDFAAAFGL